jgi:hypothetical protein
MARPSRRLRNAIIVAVSVAVGVVVVVAVGITVFGWGVSGASPSTPTGPVSNLSITFAADSDAEVNFLLDQARAYISPGDSFDLVSGSPEDSGPRVSNVINEAQELSAAFPGRTIYSHTAGIANYRTMASGIGSKVAGVFYDYEPGFEPEFTLNFTQTVSSFENVTSVAHQYNLQSVGYPIGRALLESDLQQYHWNYAALAQTVDQLVIQIQTFCVQGPSIFSKAIATALGQYQAAHLSTVPTFQITIGNSTTHLPNGVTAPQAYACYQKLGTYGLHTLYLWWDQGGESNLIAFLQNIGR